MSEGLGVVRQYRDSHHRIAQMFAAGWSPQDITHKTGIPLRRLYVLYRDPSFQELIAQYSKEAIERLQIDTDAFTHLAISNLIRSEQMISDHIAEAEESGELIPIDKLNRIVSDRADRFGYSKHSVIHHNHDFAAALDRAISRSGKVIDAKPAPTPQALIEGQSSTPPALQEPPASSRNGQEAQPQPASARSAQRSLLSALEPIKRRRIA